MVDKIGKKNRINKRSSNILSMLAVLLTIVTIVFVYTGGNIVIFHEVFPTEYMASDIQDWDLSACVSGFDTCRELYEDNESKFDNGFVSGMDDLSEVAE